MVDHQSAQADTSLDPEHPGFDMDWSWAAGQDLVWGEGWTEGESYVVLPRQVLTMDAQCGCRAPSHTHREAGRARDAYCIR